MKLALNLSACAFALAAIATAPVYAQTQSDATDQADRNDETVDSNIIVVTAQGRSQALSDVPIAVSAIGAEQLQQYSRTEPAGPVPAGVLHRQRSQWLCPCSRHRYCW